MFPGHCITKNPSVKRRAENDQEVSQLEAPKSPPPPPPLTLGQSSVNVNFWGFVQENWIQMSLKGTFIFIGWLFVWSTNVEEFSSHLLVFVAAEFFLLISIILWSVNFLERHLLTKSDSSPSNSSIFKIKTNVFLCFQLPTPPRQGSNVPLRSMEKKGGEVWMLKL